MKHLILAATLLTFFSAMAAEQIFPVRDGKSSYKIVLPARTDRQGVEKYLRHTADRMRELIRESTGADLAVVRENEVPPGTPAIYLGNTAEFRRRGGDVGKYSGLTNRILIAGNSVFLAGNDRHRDGAHWTDVYSNHQLGSVKAATDFMTGFLGVEFMMPGGIGTNVAKRKTIALPASFDRTDTPQLRMAAGRENDLLYDYANANFGFASVFHYRGHSYYAAVPRAKYAKSHPEYFMLSGGKRDSSVGHLCISNPAVQELIYQEALRRLDAGAEVVQVAQTDGYTQCECSGCSAFGGVDDPGEKLWILHRRFAERLKKERPGKLMQLLAYAPNWEPPKSFDTFPGNVIMELCRYSEADFEKWKNIKGIAGFAVYLYNWGEYPLPGLLPKRAPGYLADQARIFGRNRVTGVYRCGHGELFGLEGAGYYVHAQTLLNPGANELRLTNHYIERTFLEAAGPMRGFYAALNPRLEAFSVLESGYGKADLLPSDPRVLIGFLFSPELLANLEQKLDAADKLARDPKVKARLDLVRREFRYAASLSSTLQFYNAYRLNPDRASFDRLGDAVLAHRALVDSFYDAKGKAKKIPGWPEIRFLGEMKKSMLAANGRLGAEIGAPLNWDIGFLRARKVLPGAQMRSVTAPRATVDAQFKDFSAPPWDKAVWQELNHIQLGALVEKSRFKVIYDTKNIYFAFESDLPAGRKHKVMGHDGAPWLQDSLEILLDPLGTREVAYHFICNPLENSFYEGARGLITDPLHPKFNQEDVSWNGKWSYATRRDGDIWRVLVTIPFSSFHQNTPASGSVWTMNLARQSYHSPKMKWAGEIGLWSPNLENMFIDRNLAAFGKLIFEN